MTPKEKSRLFFSSAIVAVALIIMVVHFVGAPPPPVDDSCVQWDTTGTDNPTEKPCEVKLIPPILPVRADQPYDPYTKFVKPLLTSDDAKLEVPYRRR